MYTTACKDDTEYSISNIRRQLQNYELKLENDKKLFQDKLNRTRSKLFEEIHRLINELNDIKEEYTLEFDYLEHENLQTCDGNQRRFKDLCCLINEYEHDEEKIYRHFKEFQETFPMRPKMISNIPDIYVEDIHMKSLIKPNHFSRSTADYTPQILTENNMFTSVSTTEKVDCSSSPICFDEEISNSVPHAIEHNPNDNHSLDDEQRSSNSSFRRRTSPTTSSSFVLITEHGDSNDHIQISGAMGYSHHRSFSSQNNPTTTMFEASSRSISTATNINGSNSRVDTAFQIPYESNRHRRLMAYNVDDNGILIYSLTSHQLEYVSLQTRQINRIDLNNRKSQMKFTKSIS